MRSLSSLCLSVVKSCRAAARRLLKARRNRSHGREVFVTLRRGPAPHKRQGGGGVW